MELPASSGELRHVTVELPLVSGDGEPLWCGVGGGPGSPVDVALLPVGPAVDGLVRRAGGSLHFYDLDDEQRNDWELQVATMVHIVGFPLGASAGEAWPIWAVGHVASEPRIPYLGRPVVLIDARTTAGQSGSPVVARMWQPSGYDDDPAEGAPPLFATGTFTRLVGVYSGRLTAQGAPLDVGQVWTTEAIRRAVEAASRW